VTKFRKADTSICDASQAVAFMFYLSASVFLRTFAIVEIIFHIVNMLKTRVYLGEPALLMTPTSPPAFK
jgi:hypothetical protein